MLRDVHYLMNHMENSLLTPPTSSYTQGILCETWASVHCIVLGLMQNGWLYTEGCHKEWTVSLSTRFSNKGFSLINRDRDSAVRSDIHFASKNCRPDHGIRVKTSQFEWAKNLQIYLRSTETFAELWAWVGFVTGNENMHKDPAGIDTSFTSGIIIE